MWGPCLQPRTQTPQQLLKSDLDAWLHTRGKHTALRSDVLLTQVWGSWNPSTSTTTLSPPNPMCPKEIPWQSWIAIGQVYLVYWRCKQDWKINYKALGRSACHLGISGPDEESEMRTSRMIKGNTKKQECQCYLTHSNRLETYLVTFAILYLLVWFALLYWTFHFKNLGIKENTVKFDC